MSPKLKPLLLPQLVEQRRQTEEQTLTVAAISMHSIPCGASDATDQSDVLIISTGAVASTDPYVTTTSSPSSVATPVTPTFSVRGHVRYGSSCSSLDLASNPPCDGPASPTQSLPRSTSKRLLPDVQEEEPTEKDGDDTLLADQLGLYRCLCAEACQHGDDGPYDIDGADYDLGFLSDSDAASSDRQSIKHRYGGDSPFTGLASRFGSRFPSLTRWKSAKRANLTASPTCELSFEHAYPMSQSASRSPSSRSSSPSATPGQASVFDRAFEPPLPATPALSFWDSTESVGPPPLSIDLGKANDGRASLERDRALATTPLLPPTVLEQDKFLQLSPPPLQSPIAPSAASVDYPRLAPNHAPTHAPTSSLSSRPSVSSFHPLTYGGVGIMSPEMPISLPSLLQDHHDEWSDRLGHANFTITPAPYRPDTADEAALLKLRTDLTAARVNYTRHIVRTGENYGQTSKIYALTEAKWAEIERGWRNTFEDTRARIIAGPIPTGVGSPVGSGGMGSKPAHYRSSTSRSRSRGRGRAGSEAAPATVDDLFAGMEWQRVEDDMPTAICRMLKDAEGKKFPSLGDEDIVGPMERDAVMVRARSEERRSARLWRTLAEKVKFRK